MSNWWLTNNSLSVRFKVLSFKHWGEREGRRDKLKRLKSSKIVFFFLILSCFIDHGIIEEIGFDWIGGFREEWVICTCFGIACGIIVVIIDCIKSKVKRDVDWGRSLFCAEYSRWIGVCEIQLFQGHCRIGNSHSIKCEVLSCESNRFLSEDKELQRLERIVFQCRNLYSFSCGRRCKSDGNFGFFGHQSRWITIVRLRLIIHDVWIGIDWFG